MLKRMLMLSEWESVRFTPDETLAAAAAELCRAEGKLRMTTPLNATHVERAPVDGDGTGSKRSKQMTRAEISFRTRRA